MNIRVLIFDTIFVFWDTWNYSIIINPFFCNINIYYHEIINIIYRMINIQWKNGYKVFKNRWILVLIHVFLNTQIHIFHKLVYLKFVFTLFLALMSLKLFLLWQNFIYLAYYNLHYVNYLYIYISFNEIKKFVSWITKDNK